MNKKSKSFHIIAAVSFPDMGIGYKGSIPWSLKADMAMFSQKTTFRNGQFPNVVIMGWKTYESIPKNRRPLSNRINVVVSRKTKNPGDYGFEVVVVRSFDEAINYAESLEDAGDIFVIGGEEIYKEAMEKQQPGGFLFLTEVHGNQIQCDAFFPKIDERKYNNPICGGMSNSSGTDTPDIQYRFCVFARKEV